MGIDLKADMALDENETMEADTLNLFDVHCTRFPATMSISRTISHRE